MSLVNGEAVFMPGVDTAVPAHYGNPLREQRAFTEGAAVVDATHRGVVVVSGPDRLSWLHSLTTQFLTNLKPGESTELFVLTPQGRIEHHVRVVDDGEKTWLLVEPGKAPSLTQWLDSMRFMLRVDVVDVSQEYAAIYQPSGGTKSIKGALTWRSSWPALGPDTRSYAGVSEEDHPGRSFAFDEVIVPRGQLAKALHERPKAGMWAFEALRVAAWLPRHGVDTDDRSIPHELDWLRTAVHLHKGCYRGQETVARVMNLGKPPRRLVLLHLDGSDHELPTAGSEVTNGDRVVGKVTSVVQHWEDGPLALATIKRNVAMEAPLRVAGTPAAQTPIVVVI